MNLGQKQVEARYHYGIFEKGKMKLLFSFHGKTLPIKVRK